MDILAFFTAVFGKIDNVAILILLVMLGLMVWLNTQQRKEDREDRRATLDALGKVTEALNGVKMTLEVLRAQIK